MSVDIRLTATWQVGDSTLDLKALAQILSAIVHTGTVRGASQHLGLSYRTVWGRLEAATAALGQALIVKSRGRGSELTPAGRALLTEIESLESQLHAAVSGQAEATERRLRHAFGTPQPALRLACNYDMVLDACLNAEALDGWSVATMGANKAIAALLASQVDFAGFHHPEGQPWPPGWGALQNADTFVLVPVMMREVGLIVARGNPLDIRGIDDLTRAPIRFINRQRNAGMRTWFDALLHERGIHPRQINGYAREEFTHLAVATAVAAGAADACFTLRAVASELAVDFVPIGWERYFIAGRTALAADPRLTHLIDTLATATAHHPGYVPAPGAGGDGCLPTAPGTPQLR
ncbi:helix-turn-helix transcriptional regulator [Nitrogeniibacter mangrovi]|uniref:Helix-turn-helix transcriptional regulator n=1 Tax=Nitrogeniibacter mangrovi TaxID=2016596 RepID=A0A6C1B110_9RHOO|nr:substrate-binding domain-containing protein [Nitrogeniibacter mangrovi]QID17043.1 helix-turn-helix transcriptional regulator [Nitrogeniibacter mangrovi]